MKLCPKAKTGPYWFTTDIDVNWGNFCRFFWGFLGAWVRGNKQVRYTASSYQPQEFTDGATGEKIWPRVSDSAGAANDR